MCGRHHLAIDVRLLYIDVWTLSNFIHHECYKRKSTFFLSKGGFNDEHKQMRTVLHSNQTITWPTIKLYTSTGNVLCQCYYFSLTYSLEYVWLESSRQFTNVLIQTVNEVLQSSAWHIGYPMSTYNYVNKRLIQTEQQAHRHIIFQKQLVVPFIFMQEQ